MGRLDRARQGDKNQPLASPPSLHSLPQLSVCCGGYSGMLGVGSKEWVRGLAGVVGGGGRQVLGG